MDDVQEYREFIEDAGDLFDEHGLPPMAGRILGDLLICVPPHASLDDLVERLRVSRGAVSMATQLLTQLKIIERFSLPGHRRHYYRIEMNLWEDLFAQREEHIDKHRRLAERGLRVIADESPEMKRRLLELQVMVDFVTAELPGLAERWRIARPKLLAERLAEGKDGR